MALFTRRATAAFALAALVASAGLASAQMRVVERVMPAPVVEVMPAAPGPAFKWVPGHWVWREGNWFWMKGHYVEGVAFVPPMPAAVVEVRPPQPSPDHFWVQGHHAWEDNHWAWHGGGWMR